MWCVFRAGKHAIELTPPLRSWAGRRKHSGAPSSPRGETQRAPPLGPSRGDEDRRQHTGGGDAELSLGRARATRRPHP